MADSSQESLFRRLTQLFRSGPVIKRRVKPYQGANTSSAFEIFRKTQSHVYSTAMSAYGTYDRMARYSDFSEMEYTPEISSALDIYAEETVASDERGAVLHIFSENPKIKKILEDLFFDTLNVEFNLTAWARNLCKYGDFFLFNDVSPDHGVINVYPMPVNEVEREEGYDPNDPLAVRFRWVTEGNQVLENWQVSHFRLLGNDAFLPYGSSVLEPARRIWRQLILAEDAMLVYRVVRSPERRVFYIDVGNVPPEEIGNYMEQVQTSLKRSQVVNKESGRVDLRYNPLSVDEDYYLPVRGAESGTRIDTLAGGQNTTAVEDVEYIQKKLFAALKIPKAYLGYDEGLGAKATLSQEDIRFSRTINRIQRTILSELNKVAIIHLYSHGYDGEDLLDFDLQLSNPSTVAQQQKLELFRTRFEIAATPPEGLVDRNFLRKNILNLTDKEIEGLEEGKFEDRKIDLEIEAVTLPSEEGDDTESAQDDIDMSPPSPEDESPAADEPEVELAGDNRNQSNLGLMVGDETDLDVEKVVSLSMNDESSPIRAQNKVDKISLISESDISDHLVEDESKGDEDTEEDEEDEKKETLGDRAKYNRSRRRRNQLNTDHLAMTTHSRKDQSDSIAHPFGHKQDLVNPLKGLKLTEDNFLDSFLDQKITQNAKMTSEMRSTLKSLEKRINIPRRGILKESDNDS
tara:strand:+ start:1025 stop:3088 length:2064 start_codon:yes stop_codon:yes gene_type:complete